MTKQNQAVEVKNDKNNRPKIEPAVVSEQDYDLAGLATLPASPLGASGNGSSYNQAVRLGDVRFQIVQRQAMAAQIGRAQGDQYLQRVVNRVQRDRGDNKSRSNREYVPEISVKPDSAKIKFAEVHTEDKVISPIQSGYQLATHLL